MSESISSNRPIVITGDILSRSIAGRHVRFVTSLLHFHPLISTSGIISQLGGRIDLIHLMPFISLIRNTIIQHKESAHNRIYQSLNLMLSFPINLIRLKNTARVRGVSDDGTDRQTVETASSSLNGRFPQEFFGTQPVLRQMTGTAGMPSSITQQDIYRQRNIVSDYETGQKSFSIAGETRSHMSERETYQQLETGSVSERVQKLPAMADRNKLPATVDRNLPIIHQFPLILAHRLPAAVKTALNSHAMRRIATSLVTFDIVTERFGNEIPESRIPATYEQAIAERTRENSPTSTFSTAPGTFPPQREFNGYSRLNLNQTRIEQVHRFYPFLDTKTSAEEPRIIEEARGIDKETSPKIIQPPKIDMERLTEAVYRLFERKVRIERERRGL